MLFDTLDAAKNRLEKLQVSPVTEPFDEHKIALLDKLSKRILDCSRGREFPDLQTFGFFCRRRNIERLIKRSLASDNIKRPIGTVVHICPSNLPLNFALSFVFGFLSGNRNVVKVPKKPFGQADEFIRLVQDVFPDSENAANVFIRFDRSEDISDLILKADGILVWGGDMTIAHFRKFERKPKSIAVEFPSRDSLAVINVSELLELSKQQLHALVKKFYNDTLLVDQNACSSPKLVVWLGGNGIPQDLMRSNVDQFWQTFYAVCTEKGFALHLRERMDRLSKITQFLSEFDAVTLSDKKNSVFDLINIVDVHESALSELSSFYGTNGLFYQCFVNRLESIVPAISSPKVQTLSYFGFGEAELTEYCKMPSVFGVERIVGIGQALDFSLVWDGKYIPELLVRNIVHA